MAPAFKTRDGRVLTLRGLACGDGPALQAFNAALSEASRSLFLPHAYDDETINEVIRRSETGKDYVVVVEAEDRIVGYGFLWEFEEAVPVLGIGLADEVQGQGVGRPLMEHLIEAARNTNRDGIELTTVPSNARAFVLYQNCGFIHTGDTDNIAGDGRVVREHVLFLPLKPGAEAPERTFKPPV